MRHLIYIYIVYQYVIAYPILVVLTLFTAIFTIVSFPWKNSRFVYSVQQFWSRMCYWLLFIPVTIEGTENIQKDQSYVFVSNHQSMFDIFIIYGWLPNVFKWLMKKELRKVPFVGLACKAAGHIFIERASVRSSMESLQEVEQALVHGVSTVIFPEGTRTSNGEVGRFKRGAFQVALDLSLPIVPISLTGCYELMPKGAKYVTRHPVKMVIGKPIVLDEHAKEDPQSAIEMIREAVIVGMN